MIYCTAYYNGRMATKFGTFDELMDGKDVEIVAIARRLREVIVELHCDVVEVVRLGDRAASYGVGEKKMSEAYCYVMPQKKWVNLGFYHGANVADSQGMFEGTGKKMRHVKVRSIENVGGELVALIERALVERQEVLGL